MKPLILTAMLALFAAGLALAQETNEKPGPQWQAPADAAARVNPLADNPSAVAGGRKLFVRNCSECHGKDAAGTERAPGLQRRSVQSQTDGALFWKITNGNLARGMPSWSRLPQAQRWQLVLFLRSLPQQ